MPLVTYLFTESSPTEKYNNYINIKFFLLNITAKRDKKKGRQRKMNIDRIIETHHDKH